MGFVEDGRVEFEVRVGVEEAPPPPPPEKAPPPEEAARPSLAPLLLALLAVGGILILPVAVEER